MCWVIDDLAGYTIQELREMRHWREVSLRSHQMNLAAGVETYPSGRSIQEAIRYDQDSIDVIDEELERRTR